MRSFTATTALIFCVTLTFPFLTLSQRWEITLDEEDKYILGWSINTATQTITFDAAVGSTGYVGLGFSPYNDMWESDIAFGAVFPNGTVVLRDCHGLGPFSPATDAQQDLNILYGYETATHTYLRFSRLLDTGDIQDIAIRNATTGLIWAFGLDGYDTPRYHGPNRGNISINLLQPSFKNLRSTPLKF